MPIQTPVEETQKTPAFVRCCFGFILMKFFVWALFVLQRELGHGFAHTEFFSRLKPNGTIAYRIVPFSHAYIA
jgi:hypothetical protein